MSYYRSGDDFGIGRGARIRRTISFSGFEPYRTSTPMSEVSGVSTPRHGSPFMPMTPKGVLTQVQTKERRCPSPGQDSNNTDDLFNDSFDIDEVDISGTNDSNLSQIFPNCKVSESPAPKDDPVKMDLEGNPSESKESKRQPGDDSQVFPEEWPYFVCKWIRNLVSVVIWMLLFSFLKESKHRRGQDEEQKSFWLFDEDAGMESGGVRMDNGSNDNGGRGANKEGDGGNADGSGVLSQERIQSLLRGLAPDPSVLEPVREESCEDDNNGGAAEKTMESDGGADLSIHASWGIQIPVEFNDSGEPKRLVPVAVRSYEHGSGGPSESALEIAAAVQQVRHAVVKIVDGTVQSTGLEKHHYSMVTRRMMDEAREREGNVDVLPDQQIFRITVPELTMPPHAQRNVTFDCGRTAKFLLVANNVSTGRWTIPSRQRFHDVLNQVENRIRREFIPCHGVIEWNSEWNGVGLMGLQVSDMAALECFRTVISEMRVGGLRYNSYPKDVLAQGMEVSVFLRSELKCLDLEFIPYSLFEKNDLLDGKMAVRYSRETSVSSTEGNNGNDGKLVVLEGDEEFLNSVAKYPPNYSFKLGSSSVKIKLNESIEQRHQRRADLDQNGLGGNGSATAATNMERTDITMPERISATIASVTRAVEGAAASSSEDCPQMDMSTPQSRFVSRWAADPANKRHLPSPVPARRRGPNPDLVIRTGRTMAASNPDLVISQVPYGVGRGRGRNRTWVRGVGSRQ